MKKSILILFIFWNSFLLNAQERKLLTIDTIFLKSFSQEKIFKTLKEVRKNYRKKIVFDRKYHIDHELKVDQVVVSSFHSKDFSFDQIGNLQKHINESFFNKYNDFEMNHQLFFEKTLSRLSELDNFYFLKNNNDQVVYKMREIDSLYQITCSMKTGTQMMVVLIDKEHLLPTAVYQTTLKVAFPNSILDLIPKGTQSSISSEIIENSFKIFYTYDNGKIRIDRLEQNVIQKNYSIVRTHKKKTLIDDRFDEVVSTINLKPL